MICQLHKNMSLTEIRKNELNLKNVRFKKIKMRLVHMSFETSPSQDKFSPGTRSTPFDHFPKTIKE